MALNCIGETVTMNWHPVQFFMPRSKHQYSCNCKIDLESEAP